jgi:hypothetical protein
VVASIIIWGTVVTPLQFFGYSIALGGMVYYKLGFDRIKGYASEAGHQWAIFGSQQPVLRRITIVVLVLITLVPLGCLASSYGVSYDPSALARLGIASST